jgi:uncharacterized protein YqiB (DUF1249 family)
MDLCDENYHHLMRLAPRLHQLQGCRLSRVHQDVDLYLEVLEQTPYTTLVHLTYYFEHHAGQRPDPDATLRVYHDCRQVEVVDLRQRILPATDPRTPADLARKWRLNLFLSKWLSYCVREGHRFPFDAPAADGPVAASLEAC